MKKLIAATMLGLMGLTAAWADTTAIKAGNIVMPESGKILKDKVILVEDNLVTDIVDSVPTAGIDQVINLSDKWVMPGLIEMHAHLTLNQDVRDAAAPGWDYSFDTMRQPAGFRSLIGLMNAQSMLQEGFTTVRDVGNNGNWADSDLARALRLGMFDGPRIINSGKIISVYGGQSHRISHEVGAPWSLEYIDADSREEIIKAIRQNVFYGARLIKIVVGDQRYEYSEDDIRIFVEEAAKLDMTVAAHAYGDGQVGKSVRAGVTTVDHGENLSADILKLMARKGTILVGTDFPGEHYKYFWGDDAEANRQRIANYNMRQDEKIRNAMKHKVKMAFGTDAFLAVPGKTRGEAVQDYFDIYKRAGMPPLDFVRMLTINAAEGLKLEDFIGRIGAGYHADLIALDTNPLEDIANLKAVSFVMRGGKVVRD